MRRFFAIVDTATVGFQLSDFEKDMFEQLSVFGVLGRYPIPQEAKEGAFAYWIERFDTALAEVIDRVEASIGSPPATITT